MVLQIIYPMNRRIHIFLIRLNFLQKIIMKINNLALIKTLKKLSKKINKRQSFKSALSPIKRNTAARKKARFSEAFSRKFPAERAG